LKTRQREAIPWRISVTTVKMVQQAMVVKGEAPAEEIAAFIEKWHGVKIEPKFIPINKASIRDKRMLDEKRRKTMANAHEDSTIKNEA
jgi:hypothetical protein